MTILKPTHIRYFSILLILLGCGQYNGLEYSDDFYLIYEDSVDKINLRENTLTRKFYGEDSTIALTVTDSERRQFFQLMKTYSIWAIDESDLKIPCEEITIPAGYSRLEVCLKKGDKFELVWTGNNCHESVSILAAVITRIAEIIYAKEEVRNLADSDLIFM